MSQEKGGRLAMGDKLLRAPMIVWHEERECTGSLTDHGDGIFLKLSGFEMNEMVCLLCVEGGERLQRERGGDDCIAPTTPPRASWIPLCTSHSKDHYAVCPRRNPTLATH